MRVEKPALPVLNLTVVYRPTNSIKPEPRNARMHSKKQVAEIALPFALLLRQSASAHEFAADGFASKSRRSLEAVSMLAEKLSVESTFYSRKDKRRPWRS